jgi:hypothetical protein
MKQEITNEKVADLMTNQKLLSNKDLMIRNLDQLIQNLKECEDFIQAVIVSYPSANGLIRIAKQNQMQR